MTLPSLLCGIFCQAHVSCAIPVMWCRYTMVILLILTMVTIDYCVTRYTLLITIQWSCFYTGTLLYTAYQDYQHHTQDMGIHQHPYHTTNHSMGIHQYNTKHHHQWNTIIHRVDSFTPMRPSLDLKR